MDIRELQPKVESLRCAAYELLDEITAHGLSGTTEELAEAAVDVHSLLGLIKDMYGAVSADVIHQVEFTPEPIDVGGVTVEIKSGSPRKKWDHTAAISDVADRLKDLAVDMDTGERLMSTEQIISEVAKYAGISYWRVKPMKDLGLNVDMYCEVGDAKTNLVIRKGK